MAGFGDLGNTKTVLKGGHSNPSVQQSNLESVLTLLTLFCVLMERNEQKQKRKKKLVFTFAQLY